MRVRSALAPLSAVLGGALVGVLGYFVLVLFEQGVHWVLRGRHFYDWERVAGNWSLGLYPFVVMFVPRGELSMEQYLHAMLGVLFWVAGAYAGWRWYRSRRLGRQLQGLIG